jgi:putative ABC transport system ATP-binding protein
VAAEAVLQTQGVSKYYTRVGQQIAAIENVSLEITPGTLTIIRGPSGSGKTTLLLAAGGLLRPDKGKMLVQRKDIYTLTPDQRAVFRGRNIGFVFQQFYLVPYLSVIENVKVPAMALPIAHIEERAAALLERFQLSDRLSHFPSELSTGERQRVALARALVAEPGLLLADEPTGNLDLENEQIIVDCLREYARNGGAVLMATHGLRTDGFDHVLHLDGGRLQTG